MSGDDEEEALAEARRASQLARVALIVSAMAAALAILGVTFAIYYSKLATQANPMHQRLAQIGIEDFAVPPRWAPQRISRCPRACW